MKTNLRSQRVSSFGRCLALAALALASGGVGLDGCAGGGGSDEDLGQARLAIGNVPNNVHCVRITAQGASRTVVRSVDVMPGQTVQTTLSGLPTGQVVFTAEAFSTACAAAGAGAVPTWVSDPVTVTVATSPIVNVSLTLHPNGQATVGVGFQDDPTCFPTGSMCVTDAQCCTGQLCTGGTCSTPVMCMAPAPVAGDCQTQTCDASGNVVSIPDDTDVPADDGNPCTIEECAAGSPVHAFAPVGLPCNQNGGSVCNGMGACAQCVTAAQCPGMDSDCQVRACSNNTCGFLFTAAGTPTSAQVPGNCRQNQCDGMGGIMSAIDSTDVPVDGNACTLDICTSGIPSNPFSQVGTACNQSGGTACNGAGISHLARSPRRASRCPVTGRRLTPRWTERLRRPKK